MERACEGYQDLDDGDDDRNEEDARGQRERVHVRLGVGGEADGLSGVERGAAQRDARGADVGIAEAAQVHFQRFLRAAREVQLAPNGLVARLEEGERTHLQPTPPK